MMRYDVQFFREIVNFLPIFSRKVIELLKHISQNMT